MYHLLKQLCHLLAFEYSKIFRTVPAAAVISKALDDSPFKIALNVSPVMSFNISSADRTVLLINNRCKYLTVREITKR